ncbi:MAG TPA: DUF2652 domain-containing protein [Chitinophagaceae bacterium]
MESRGLLFIPDISGFTRFVNQTDIEHSSLIIRELLEVLINANEIGLEVSEIEGDAILFYKYGENPGLKTLYQQVQKMFCAFHKRLIVYDHNRFCQCNACMSAITLTLKVITHYGEFTGYTIQHFNKLIGKDVIVAHQLLKNDIEQHEYWLVTDNLLQNEALPDLAQWMKWDQSARQTETGEVAFHYTQLGKLKDEIEPDPPLQLELSDKVKVLSVSKEYETDIIHLFHATGDFNYRSRWQEDVKAVEEVSHFLPRVGMKFRRIGESGEATIYASSYTFHPERIEFSETDETKKNATYYTLEKIGTNKIKLTLDYYIPKNIAGQLLFNLFHKKKMEKKLIQSLKNLDTVVKEIKLPGED